MLEKLLPLAALILWNADRTFSEREHKVHNIVLYPEKHSWCQTTPIQQVMSSAGYESVTVINNVCVGACYSYSIPKTQPAEPGELIGPYCDSCQPAEMQCYHVTLKAEASNVEGPPTIKKRVQIITNCTCQSCNKISKEDCDINDDNTVELPKYLYAVQETQSNITEESPDLFEVQNNATQTKKNSEDDSEYKFQLKQWFEQWSIKNKSKDDADEDNEININVLEHNEEDNLKIEQDLARLPAQFGLEGVPSHQKGAHIASGIQHSSDNDVERKHHNHHHGGNHHPHHHHVGEEVQIGSNLAHLVRGPHGSMVLGPAVDVKLHIDGDSLKPNNEGLILEYENHHKNHHKKVGDIIDEK